MPIIFDGEEDNENACVFPMSAFKLHKLDPY